MLELSGAPEITAATLATLELLADDPVNKPRLISYLTGPGPHAELRTVVRSLARALQPRRYLEIGVRLGWSLAQVAAECPTCAIVACDVWTPNYGGVANPGPGFVRTEVARAVPQYYGHLVFVDGPSQKWLPTVTDGVTFDLITVDGDHTGLGAREDLRLCLPKVAPGGALVFDDLVDTSDDHGSLTLRGAWEWAKATFDGFAWHELAGMIPVGVAVRWTGGA